MEIEYMRKLNHPSIIGLSELFEGENTFYLILEYLQGKCLKEMIHQQRSGDGFTIE
jgi:serine/threonine protein kinase